MPGNRGISEEQKLMRILSGGADELRNAHGKVARLIRRTQRDILEAGVSPGSASPSGDFLQNMKWVWVIGTFNTIDTATPFVHNLDLPLRADGLNNVGYFLSNLRHDGTGVNAASTLSINFDVRDVGLITPNVSPLRLYVGGTRTVNATHPVEALAVFFGK